MIEHATGRPVSDALREQILDPLKLHDTVLQPQERPPSETARGYGGPPRVARALRTGGRYAPYTSEASCAWTAGGMVASAPSVARFADALLRGELLSAESRRSYCEFVPAGEGYDGYGLGVGKGDRQGPKDVVPLRRWPRVRHRRLARARKGDHGGGALERRRDLGLLTTLLATRRSSLIRATGRCPAGMQP